jgi:hypothetical protein
MIQFEYSHSLFLRGRKDLLSMIRGNSRKQLQLNEIQEKYMAHAENTDYVYKSGANVLFVANVVGTWFVLVIL